MLTTAFFSNNRKRLRQLCSSDALIVVTAHGLMQRNNDSAHPFRQESNFFYLTGSDEPNLVLVMDGKSGEEFIILPTQTEVERYFGGIIDCDEIAKITGIQQLYAQREGWDVFKKMQKSRKKIYTIPAPPVQFTRQERMFSSPARRLLIQKLRRISPLPIESLSPQLIELRSVKHSEEIEMLKKAIDITASGLRSVKKRLDEYEYEYEVEATLDYEFKARGSKHGFAPPIVAAGKNATIVHYQKNNAPILKDDLLLLDIGAEWCNYGADVSRTYKVAGELSVREREVLEAISSVSKHAISLLRPGLSWRDYILSVDDVMGKELFKMKLIHKNERSEVRQYFPYSISHSLGLDTHDICDYTQPMREGMVITVEPGIHILEEGIGARIEDDILITKNGSVNLSADIPYA